MSMNSGQITVAAIDLGAESGRVVTANFDGTRLALQVQRRFANTPSRRAGALRWDVDALWSEIGSALGELASGDRAIAAVGVDTWGVDYGLIGNSTSGNPGALLDAPISYRDERNADSLAKALAEVGPATLYQATGTQIMQINSLFALMADVRDMPLRLEWTAKLLMMPDVFHHLLAGSQVTEYTAASTTGAMDMATGEWATDLLDRLGVPTHILPEIALPGTDVGEIIGESAVGRLTGARVILPPGHDTASAVVAVPFAQPGGLFISSGTWSLAGVEIDKAIINAESQAANLTNEGGYDGSIRLLRNVMGLWILQQCRRQWATEGTDLSYPQIAEMATREPPLVSIINPDAMDFLAPGDMPGRIRAYCAKRGLPVPQTIGEVARCVVDSLALSYRATVNDIAAVTGHRPPSINIVGGGANHTLLSQVSADATGLPVYCGPVEATALGNAAVQLVALGEISGLAQIRQVIADGEQIITYEPRPDPRWDEAAARHADLIAADNRDKGLAAP